MVEDVTVRLAGRHDVENVVALLSKRASWVQAQGFVQWPVPFPATYVDASIRAEETFVATKDTAIIGTIALCESDQIFWPTKSDDALYIHRLAASPNERGLGAFLLAWAKTETQRRAMTYLRLDCGAHNPHLRAYYLAQGFTAVGKTTVTLEKDHVPEGVSQVWTSMLFEARLDGDQSEGDSTT
jgi:GNAT superfamily N-acetyltransferase